MEGPCTRDDFLLSQLVLVASCAEKTRGFFGATKTTASWKFDINLWALEKVFPASHIRLFGDILGKFGVHYI